MDKSVLAALAGSPSSRRSNDNPRHKVVEQVKATVKAWNSSVKGGKATLDQIVEERRSRFQHDDTEETDSAFSPEVQKLCFDLKTIVEHQEDLVSDLKVFQDKLKNVVALDALKNKAEEEKKIISDEKLEKSLQTIVQSYSQQSRVNRYVLEEIGLCRTESDLLLQTTTWVHQPYVDVRCVKAEAILNDFLATSS